MESREENAAIDHAVTILREGGLVAFPTETVYGLGADATQPQAVGKIYQAKGRPGTNPLIVHVFDIAAARRCTQVWPQPADVLARQFWPGPLTLVVPRAGVIAPAVSAGRDTVGLRSPAHPLALRLLQKFDGPIAAPSANRSNRVSPTTAAHVRKELGSSVDLILDGGPCQVGIESTVLDLSTPKPIILRQGAITQLQIERWIGPVEVSAAIADPTQSTTSPGQHAVHYSPATPAYRFASQDTHRVIDWCRSHPNSRPVLLSIGFASPEVSDAGISVRDLPGDPMGYAHQIYSALHEADTGVFTVIFIQLPPADQAWAAINDRLTRATRPL